MRKSLLSIMVAGIITTSVFGGTIKLNINDKNVVTTVAPVQEEGTTLVPLRVVSENLGADVKWDGATQSVIINKDGIEIKLVLGSKTVVVNGVEEQLTVAPKSMNGTTMVPIRFVSENLDGNVEWDSASSTVSINSSARTDGGVPKQEEKPNDTLVSTGSEVYVTGKGKKYHTQGCRYVNNTSVGLTLEDAKNKEYEACKVCTP